MVWPFTKTPSQSRSNSPVRGLQDTVASSPSTVGGDMDELRERLERVMSEIIDIKQSLPAAENAANAAQHRKRLSVEVSRAAAQDVDLVSYCSHCKYDLGRSPRYVWTSCGHTICKNCRAANPHPHCYQDADSTSVCLANYINCQYEDCEYGREPQAQRTMVLYSCNHAFCPGCIKQYWGRRDTCPKCTKSPERPAQTSLPPVPASAPAVLSKKPSLKAPGKGAEILAPRPRSPSASSGALAPLQSPFAPSTSTATFGVPSTPRNLFPATRPGQASGFGYAPALSLHHPAGSFQARRGSNAASASSDSG